MPIKAEIFKYVFTEGNHTLHTLSGVRWIQPAERLGYNDP